MNFQMVTSSLWAGSGVWWKRTGWLEQSYLTWLIWSGLPFLSWGDPPNPEVEHGSPALQVDSLPSEPLWKPNLTLLTIIHFLKKKKKKKRDMGMLSVRSLIEN